MEPKDIENPQAEADFRAQLQETKDRVCDECGCIHKNGISWHGRCYHCGGELIPWNEVDHELTAVTPKGIQIFERKSQIK